MSPPAASCDLTAALFTDNDVRRALPAIHVPSAGMPRPAHGRALWSRPDSAVAFKRARISLPHRK